MSYKQFIPHEQLLNYTEEIFKKVGLDTWGAQEMASHLVAANLRGVDSHGVSRIPLYTERLFQGYIEPGSNVEVMKDFPSYLWLDGHNRHGILVAKKAIEKAVEKAKSQGVAVVGVKNSNHFGMLAHYGRYAVDHDCVAVITSNASPSMPPWGGRERFFGTSPICYAIPAGEEDPIIGDMATSVVARGKIRLADKNKEKIPEGWAISKDGKNTTDPAEALEGMVLPMAGAKGYSLIVLIETLSSILTGAAIGPHAGAIVDSGAQKLGHFFLVMRPDIFQSLDEFKSRVDQMIREIKGVKKMEGVEQIFLPGEIERETEKVRLNDGIPLSEKVYQELVEVGQKVGSDFNISDFISTQ